MIRLPIDWILPELTAALRDQGRAVLQAPPGAGKTTRVPVHLLQSGIVEGRILVLEPRRVAARAAAERLAEELGEKPGRSVGYRIRGEAVAGSRIEVVTEGILTRMIQSDAGLPGIGCIIFDEFHERALQADLGLALALEIRAALREDLKILVMSATLDAEPVAALMDGAPVLTSQGRSWPVETVWLDRPWQSGVAGRPPRFEAAVGDLVLRALHETEGGVLVFLPGQGEINRTSALLSPRLPADVTLQPLHGGLPFARQRAALTPVANGRKLVLATSIAETSLTIPDVRVVVDGGRSRRARFDPGSGMTRLVTERVTRAEAVQRQGRAGRVAPGRCYRLWTRGEEGALGAFAPPEIATADLAGLALELALWGAWHTKDMAFLTPPPAPAMAEARDLLAGLGALDRTGAITRHGRALARLPLHPRLAHMVLEASGRGGRRLACDLAALLQARDPLRGQGGRPPVDLALRLAALKNPERVESEHPVQAGRAEIKAIRSESSRLARRVTDQDGAGLSPGAVLSLAYPDRIGLRRSGAEPRYLLSGGKGARLPADDPLANAPMIVAADLDGDPREAAVRLALPVTQADILDLHADLLRRDEICEWSRREGAVIARRRLMLGALALEDRRWTGAPPEDLAGAMIEGIRDSGLDALPWSKPAISLAGRVEWLRAQGEAGLPDFSREALAEGLERWLSPFLAGLSRAEDFQRIDLVAALSARLDRDARQRLDRLAPGEITAPTGTRLPVDYSGDAPFVSVRLQEMFGLNRHPVIGPARVPLVVELLSPARRAVQTTSDLPGFWASSYADVRRDMRGRYPRHPWPEDPAATAPTRRVKPRRNKGR